MKLLQHGADTSIRGWHEETPLEAAQRNNHAAIHRRALRLGCGRRPSRW